MFLLVASNALESLMYTCEYQYNCAVEYPLFCQLYTIYIKVDRHGAKNDTKNHTGTAKEAHSSCKDTAFDSRDLGLWNKTSKRCVNDSSFLF